LTKSARKKAIMHPLTDIGLERFVADWKATKKAMTE
jgi:transaldolase